MASGKENDMGVAAEKPGPGRTWRAWLFPLAALAALGIAQQAKAAPGFWVANQFGFPARLGTLVVGQKLMGPVAGIPSGLFFVSFNYITNTGRVTGGSYIFIAFQGTTPIGIQFGQIVPRIAGFISVVSPPFQPRALQLALAPTFGLGLFAFSTGPGTVSANTNPQFTIAQGQVNINLFQQTAFFFPFP
jgi:hypothetical protein